MTLTDSEQGLEKQAKNVHFLLNETWNFTQHYIGMGGGWPNNDWFFIFWVNYFFKSSCKRINNV